jgi:replicative DNA helicase
MSGARPMDRKGADASTTCALDDVRQVLRQDVLFSGGRRPAPPHDLEAEQVITASAIAGHVAEVEVRDFYSESYGAIFLAAAEMRADGIEPTDDRIVHVLRGIGDSGPLLRLELQTLRDAVPITVRLADLSRRIFVAARRRKACEHVTRAEALLRSGEDASAIVAELRSAAAELKRCAT